MSAARVAIITGASSGIGRALAERAVRAGWNVYAVGRRVERLDELGRRVEGATGKLVTLALDLRTPQAAARIVRGTLDAFGRIDVLVNDAGGTAVGNISEQSDAALAEQFETHVIVPLALTREALPPLRAVKGQIFYVGSGVARIPVSMLGAYPPAKAAVRNMSRIVRNELRGDGIAVTYVDPGAVATEFMTRVGFAGPPRAIAALPQDVALRIFEAFTSRKAVVNAVPWQTFFVALGEAVPGFTDFILRRAPGLVGGDALPVIPAPVARPLPIATQPDAAEPVAVAPDALPAAPETLPATPFEAALAPHERRMQKLNLSQAFLRGLLVPPAELELGDVAMRWAGMPNKNERALTNDVLDALASGGYLEHLEPERYRVVRAAE